MLVRGIVYKGIHWLREALQMYEPEDPTCLLILQEVARLSFFMA